ncbi:MAG: XPA-binding protein 1 [Amphiamblys sp. WSBS2006]|nr:MAG: XPA-binding protein 1 [Amphiamblys sp. WSBS2006]
MSATPINILVIGMAGSGKTSLVSKLADTIGPRKLIVNLDPAVKSLPYTPDIDIREKQDHRKVMEVHGLGPNGATMTCLNLFALESMAIAETLEKKKGEVDFVLIDTPGQIEAFTWSVSGEILTRTFSLAFPTVVVYVADTPRCESPLTFSSNLLYCCSILYKLQKKAVLAFNKTDAKDHAFAIEWMKNPHDFLRESNSTMAGMFSQAITSVLEEFHQAIPTVGISARTGDGLGELLGKIRAEATRESEESRP